MSAPLKTRALSFREARAVIVRELTGTPKPSVEHVPLGAAPGRVLAEEILADRDYPALDRSARDGFAVRSADLPGRLRKIGEVRAGERFSGTVQAGEAVEIMTGAPIPDGADAVVMIEHVSVDGDSVVVPDGAAAGQFINFRGGEAPAGAKLLQTGTRLDYTDIGLLAAVGCVSVPVFAKPRVAILATGDELVSPEQTPQPQEIRDSNAYSLAAQVERAGGVPHILDIARDDERVTVKQITRGLTEADLLLLSGGVSAGKYDVVEPALRSLGAHFFFDRVAIQPGQPLVFGRARDKVFFGLPGNPASTIVTFEMFARTALTMLAGQPAAEPIFLYSRLTRDYNHRPGLTRFLPAFVSSDGELTPVPWTGSSDIAALTRANAFMVVDAERADWRAGDLMRTFLK